jgi:hypothetical protein
MRVKKNLSWLLLLLRLPATHTAQRVAIWRKLKKSGAIQIQTSTYILPDEPARYESFQWLTQHIRDAGGDATLVRAREIEGLPNEKLIGLFNSTRAKEYTALAGMLRSSKHRGKTTTKEPTPHLIDRVRKQFREIQQTDFFDCPRAQDVEMLLGKLEGDQRSESTANKIRSKDYRSRTWLTRPRPEIDRVGSAWLIRNFIDPNARFIFGQNIQSKRRVVSFDMLNAEFSHQGDDCTFETLTKRFGIQDKTLRKIGQMIHDADLDDGKFGRNECMGIDRVLKGWAKEGLADREILRRGFECFEALHAFLRRV